MEFKMIPKLVLAFCVIGWLSATVHAAESTFNEQLSIGDPAPTFSDLPGTDGKTHGLDEYEAAKAIAVVFTSNQCPVAIDYEDRIVALERAYRDRGVQLVAICANFEAGNELDALKERAESKGFRFPYLRDDTQEVGRAYGASHTPHAFLLDGERKIVYMGAIDDNEDPAKVSRHYLREAIESILTGRRPEPAESQPVGCRIRYKRRASR